MSNHGVLSLRCPSCGRPFLSLPQQGGTLVTCPHCAVSAPMAAFSTSHSPAGAPTALPLRRRVARQPDFTPAWATPIAQVPGTTGQRQITPPQRPAFGSPAWPPAPEAPPMFTPQTAGNMPTAVVAPWLPESYLPETAPVYSPGVFGIAEHQPHLQAQYQPPPAQSPPTVASPPIDFAAMRESPQMLEADMETWSPPRQHSSLFPFLILLFVVTACVWVLREDLFPPMVVEIPVARPAVAIVKSAPVSPKATASASPPTVTLAPPPEPVPEIRRAEIAKPKIDLMAASDAGQKLFLDLIEAESPAVRAALISQPDENAADVEEFFAAGKIELLSFKPSNATPLTLPGHDPVPLFQVTTKANSHGALLRVLPQANGSFLLDWPLFAETHERKLAGFLEKKPAEPAWFHLGLRRSHGLELPQSSREIHVAFKLQGSADSSLSCLAVAQKDIPIGRYLARETDWTDIYIARLLLQHRKLADGTDSIVILDCEGAAKADLQ